MIDWKQIDPFLDALFLRLAQTEIPFQAMELDHICYRVETQARYAHLHRYLASKGELLSEKNINGRPICTFKLHQAIQYQDRLIDLVELPSPKEGSPYQEGFEHVELVCGQHPRYLVAQYPHLSFDIKGMQKAVNADVRLQFPEGSVKFHAFSLEYVIRFLE